MQTTYSISSVQPHDYSKIGIRAANLAKLKFQGLQVKIGFIIPSIIYEDYSISTGLRNKMSKIAETTGITTRETQERAHQAIKEHLERNQLQKQYDEELKEAYEALPANNNKGTQSLLTDTAPTVNLILSPSYQTNPDDPLTIFNITGYHNLKEAIKSCWLQLYKPESIEYRNNNGITEFTTAIIIQPVQKPEKTLEINTKPDDQGSILICAYHGGIDIYKESTKDTYLVDKSLAIKAAKIAHQDYKLIYPEASGIIIKRKNVDKANAQKISEKEIIEAATRATKAKEIIGEEIKIYITITKDKQEIVLVDELAETGKPLPEKEENKELALAEREIDEYIARKYEEKTGLRPESIDQAIMDLYAKDELPADEEILQLKKMSKMSRAGEPINPQALQETIRKIKETMNKNGY